MAIHRGQFRRAHVAKCQQTLRRGLTLLELLLVVTILGTVAALAVAGFVASSERAKVNACYLLKGDIAVQAQLWYRNTGNWPATDLGDIGLDSTYFPEGIPPCPVDGNNYTFDSNARGVPGHSH